MRFSQRNRLTDTVYLIFLLTLLVSTGCGGFSKSLDRKADKEIYGKLIAIRKEFRKLRAGKASSEQWKVFANKVKSETKPMVEDLEKRAEATKPATQNLLFATRDSLPFMLFTAREQPNENERQFDKHLEFVRKHLGVAPVAAD